MLAQNLWQIKTHFTEGRWPWFVSLFLRSATCQENSPPPLFFFTSRLPVFLCNSKPWIKKKSAACAMSMKCWGFIRILSATACCLVWAPKDAMMSAPGCLRRVHLNDKQRLPIHSLAFLLKWSHCIAGMWHRQLGETKSLKTCQNFPV